LASSALVAKLGLEETEVALALVQEALEEDHQVEERLE
jgi:sulfur carrier protein ThiS